VKVRTRQKPISLASFLLSGLEKLVDRYFRSGPLVSALIHPRQHAFQAGKSTESALYQLVGRIEKAVDAIENTPWESSLILKKRSIITLANLLDSHTMSGRFVDLSVIRSLRCLHVEQYLRRLNFSLLWQ